MAQPTVTIYSTPSCHYCHLAKDFFTAHDIVFTDVNVAEDRDAAKAMVKRTGQMGVPVIDIGTETVVGFNEEKVRALLNIK
jgi:glutaredoxin 3